MQTNIRTNARVINTACVMALILLTGCADATHEDADVPVPTVSYAKSADSASSKGYLEIGDIRYEFDTVVCIGGFTPTAIASDSQKRPSLPTLSARVFPQVEGSGSSTFSAQFSHTEPKVFWRLQEGQVTQDKHAYIGAGTLQGVIMQEQRDGTLKEGAVLPAKPFTAQLTCR